MQPDYIKKDANTYMKNFIFYIFIQIIFLFPSMSSSCPLSGYLILKGTGLTPKSKNSINLYNFHSISSEKTLISKVAISIISALPHDVASQNLEVTYRGVNTIGKIPELYGDGVIIGQFHVDEKESEQYHKYLFRELELEGYLNERLTFLNTDDDVLSKDWAGLTYEHEDLQVCLLLPNVAIYYDSSDLSDLSDLDETEENPH